MIKSADGDTSTVADITFASGSTVTSTGVTSGKKSKGKDGDLAVAGITILGHGGDDLSDGSTITFGGTVTSKAAGVIIKENDGDLSKGTASTIVFTADSTVLATGSEDGDTGVEIKGFSGSDITFAGSVTSNAKGIKLDDGASSTINFAAGSSVSSVSKAVEIKKFAGSDITFAGSITSSAGEGVKLDDGASSTIIFAAGSSVSSVKKGVEIKKFGDSSITFAGSVTSDDVGVKLDSGSSGTITFASTSSVTTTGIGSKDGDAKAMALFMKRVHKRLSACKQ